MTSEAVTFFHGITLIYLRSVYVSMWEHTFVFHHFYQRHVTDVIATKKKNAVSENNIEKRRKTEDLYA